MSPPPIPSDERNDLNRFGLLPMRDRAHRDELAERGLVGGPGGVPGQRGDRLIGATIIVTILVLNVVLAMGQTIIGGRGSAGERDKQPAAGRRQPGNAQEATRSERESPHVGRTQEQAAHTAR